MPGRLNQYIAYPLSKIWERRKVKPPAEDESHWKSILDEVIGEHDICKFWRAIVLNRPSCPSYQVFNATQYVALSCSTKPVGPELPIKQSTNRRLFRLGCVEWTRVYKKVFIGSASQGKTFSKPSRWCFTVVNTTVQHELLIPSDDARDLRPQDIIIWHLESGGLDM